MDLLKFFAIFLVLWGHAEQYLLSCDYADRAVYRIIYSFHMPLFMMISGFFFAMTVKPHAITNILVKARQLLIPAAVWAILFSLPSAIIHHILPPFDLILEGSRYGFWFLRSVFACCILGLFPFLVFRKYFWLASLVTLILSQFLFVVPTVKIPYMYPAFLLGGIIYHYHDRFIEHSRLIIALSGFVWIMCCIFLDGETYRIISFLKGEAGPFIDITIIQSAGYQLYMYVMGLCGSVAFLALFNVIFSTPRSGRAIGVVSDWGKMTLGIYILQTYLLETLLARHIKFDGIPDPVFDFIIAPLIALAVMTICVYIIRLIRLNGYVSFFLLGTKWPDK